MLNLNFQNGQAPALNARNMNAIVESINTLGYAVGGPNVASTVSAMTNTSKVYVYTGSETGYTAGNWYYYNGSAWVSGGVYQAAAVETDTTLTVSGAAADAKVTGDKVADLKNDMRKYIRSNVDTFTEYSDFNSQFYFKDYNVEGYFSNNGVWDESLGRPMRSVICSIKPGAKICYSGRLSPYGCVLAFLDEGMNFISSLKVLGNPNLAVKSGFIDCSGQEYQNVAYVVASNYAQNDYSNYKTAYIFITYDTTKLDTIDHKNYLPMIQYGLYKVGAFHVDNNAFYSSHNSGTSLDLWNSGFIEIDNKTCSKIQYRYYLNDDYYGITFFDKYYKILPDISIVSPTEGAYVRDGEIDLSSDDYNSVKYVMVCSYVAGGLDENRHGEYVKILSSNYLNSLKTELQHFPPSLNSGTVRIFKKVVCVGDSYTAGWHKVSGDTTWTEQPEYAWPHYISDITSNQWLNCGVSGVNVWEWLENNNGLVKCTNYGLSQGYVIGLMINDTSELPLGSTSDIGTDNRTYYGGMSKVIRSLSNISPSAHIFVCTCPKTTTGYTAFNQAVRDIVTDYLGTYKVHLIDLAEHMNLFDVSSFTADAINGHYTAIGYEQMAEIMAYLISEYINAHVLDFQDVYKIPYDPA